MLKAVLDKTPVIGPTIIYDVYSDNLIVGRITQHNTGGGNFGTWGYSFSFANRYPGGSQPPRGGSFKSMDEAMKAMREQWNAWLEWAGLQEREAHQAAASSPDAPKIDQ